MEYEVIVASCTETGGIYRYIWSDGAFEQKACFPCDRPMYFCEEDEHLYVLLRQAFDDGCSAILSLAPDATGILRQTAAPLCTNGRVACHICRFHGHSYAANYISGSVFSDMGKCKAHSGTCGPHPRQDAPHVHCLLPDPQGRYLLAADLGLDTVMVYTPQLTLFSSAAVPAGHGARHLAFSQDGRFLFCVNELGSSCTVFSYDKGQLSPLDTVSVLHHSNPNNLSAAIRVVGSRVYISNRGNDSISCLNWDGKSLRLLRESPCGGCFPRDFAVVDNYLFCANERSNTVSILTLEEDKLLDRGFRIPVDAPLCITVCKPQKPCVLHIPSDPFSGADA